jgi:L-iditol 2-dehydrogenase
VRALVLTSPGQLEMLDVPGPAPADDEVVIRVRAAGICGSDVHGMDGSSGRRIPPLIMGHEAAGLIESVGAAVSGWRAGDAVTFDSTVWCGECTFCREGRTNLCDRRRVVGVATPAFRHDGAFADRVVVPARIVHGLPAGVPMTHAALVEPLAVAAHAVARGNVARSDRVLVVGAGTIGLLIMQLLHAAGCPQVAAVDLSAERLARAGSMGATDMVRGGDGANERLREVTRGRGFDVAFEAVGVDAAVSLAIASVRKGGRVVLVGNVVPSVTLPLQDVVSRELTLIGTAASATEFPRAIELIATGEVDVGTLISEVVPLSEGANAFARLRQRGGDLLKVVLEP